MADMLDEFYQERKTYYLKTYDNIDEIPEEKTSKYFQITENQKKVLDDEVTIEYVEELLGNNSKKNNVVKEEISIEKPPF
jgi:hypothetical protein